MKFSVSKEVLQVLEFLESSKRVMRLLWAILAVVAMFGFGYLVHAVRWW